jgi:hypothetical protein
MPRRDLRIWFSTRFGGRATTEQCAAAILVQSWQSIIGVLIQVTHSHILFIIGQSWTALWVSHKGYILYVLIFCMHCTIHVYPNPMMGKYLRIYHAGNLFSYYLLYIIGDDKGTVPFTLVFPSQQIGTSTYRKPAGTKHLCERKSIRPPTSWRRPSARY